MRLWPSKWRRILSCSPHMCVTASLCLPGVVLCLCVFMYKCRWCTSAVFAARPHHDYPLTISLFCFCFNVFYLYASFKYAIYIVVWMTWPLPFCACQVGGTFDVDVPSNHVPCCLSEPCCLITGEGETRVACHLWNLKKKKKRKPRSYLVCGGCRMCLLYYSQASSRRSVT